MKKFLVTAIVFLLLAPFANSEEINLKGFKLGMTKKEFKKNWKSKRVKVHQAFTSLIIPHYTVTLAGVNVDKLTIWYLDIADITFATV